MDAGRPQTDFSIQRILSPQLGVKPPAGAFPADGPLQGVPGGPCLDSGSLRPPAPLAMPVPGLLQYRGLSCGDGFYTYGAGFHPNPEVFVCFAPDSAGAQTLAGYHGYQQDQQQLQRQKTRMRTVFTDSQTKHLEALFELTDYPAAEVRAQVARSTGLSEETVRIWFKNRRARRKRQCSESKVKSPSRPCSAGAEKKLFTTFL